MKAEQMSPQELQEFLETKHEILVENLTKDGQDILNSMTAEKVHLLHMAVGIAGEAGELLDAIKKSVVYNAKLDVDNVVEELGDLEFYMRGMRQGLALPRNLILSKNINKLTMRYGDKYSDSGAQKRADKE